METHSQGSSGRSFDAIKQDLSSSLLAIRKPTDFITTLIYCIPLLAPIRVCLEIDVFQQLVDHAPRSLTAAELSKRLEDSNAGEGEAKTDFIVRMMRAVCVLGLADEDSGFTYKANELTTTLADPGFSAGFQLLFDNAMGPRSTMTEMVSYHASNDWNASSTALDGPWQRSRGTAGKSTFDSWVHDDPKQLERLSSLMQRMQKDRPHWTTWLPENVLFESSTGPFVDVGGGRGHDFNALATRYPDRDVKLIVQDLESVIVDGNQQRSKSGEKLDGRISFSVHDFFEPQPIHGASVYYMHKDRIMHDWPDSECVKILSHLRNAMSEGSRIFINDVLLPNRGCSLLHTAFDVDMLALHSGLERDERMWQRLVTKVGGLSIRKLWYPPDGEGEGIVEVVRSDTDG